jgi:hypothetical protein
MTVPDKEGTFYFLGVGMTYTQPVTNTEYSLFFPLNVPPAIVVEGDYTGSITIGLDGKTGYSVAPCGIVNFRNSEPVCLTGLEHPVKTTAIRRRKTSKTGFSS